MTSENNFRSNNGIEFALSKMLDITRSISENNGRVVAFIENLEKKLPDVKEVDELHRVLLEIKESIGKSDINLIQLINQLSNLLQSSISSSSNSEEILRRIDNKLITENFYALNLQEHYNITRKLSDYVNLLEKQDYTDTDLNKLGKFVKNSLDIHKMVSLFKKRVTIIISAVSLLLAAIGLYRTITWLIM